ncbi:hypothetical protein BH10PSE2_BH10PSE2_11650 [soil metagenome]
MAAQTRRPRSAPANLPVALLVGMALAFGGSAASAAMGQITPPTPPQAFGAVTACRDEADSTRRLACYDAAVGALVEAERGGDVVVIDRAQVRTARRQLFGFELPAMPSLLGGDAEADRVSQVESTLTTAVVGGADQSWTFTLADGTVWRQVGGGPARFQNRPGSPVRVRRATMGSYLLSVGHGGGIRVRRQQ